MISNNSVIVVPKILIVREHLPPVSRLCAVGRLSADPRRGRNALVEDLRGLLGAAAQDGELRGTGEVGFVLVDDGLKVGNWGMGQNPGTFCSPQNSWDLWM